MNGRGGGGFIISAPASSANLGSGFDAVGIGIELRMTAHVRALGAGEAPVWSYHGAHAPSHNGIRTCIEAGIAQILGTTPPLAVALDNAIPLGAGLGSSAAAFAIGVAIGAQLSDVPPGDDALAYAVVALEGHPDNALAAWYGGTIVAALGEDGLTSIRLPPLAVAAVVVVPDFVLTTSGARALLPREYARDDAVYNVQRAALLGAALAAGRLDLLRAAVRDRLHQPYRAGAIPGLAAILALDDPALLAVALSGAGPSVLALVRDDPERLGAAIAAAFAVHGIDSTVLMPELATRGIDRALALPGAEWREGPPPAARTMQR